MYKKTHIKKVHNPHFMLSIYDIFHFSHQEQSSNR